MLKPLIFAFLVAALPIAAESPARAGEGASNAADVSEAGYQRDVARGAELSIEETELTLKFNAGKISPAHYRARLARIRAETDDLSSKWSQSVNRRAAVMFTGDVFIKAAPRINELKREYAPATPKPALQPEPRPAPYDPYLAAQERDAQATPPGEVLIHNLPWFLLMSFAGVALVGILAIFIGRWFPSKEEEGEPEPEVSTNYGTASFAKLQLVPLSRAYVSRGVFFGKSSDPKADDMPAIEQPGAPICSLPANHTLIVARTRTGKGTRVIIPTLLRYMGSAIVIDPKGENAAITARARENIIPGYETPVHILNPWKELNETFRAKGIKYDRLNPLELVDRTNPNAVAMAQSLANVISPRTGGKDDYWAGSAANILAAVFLWLADQPGEQKTLARAREITSLSRKRFTEEFMVKMAASGAFGGAIRELIGPYLDLANDTYSGIISNLSEAMKFVSDPQLKASTEFTTFNLAEIIASPTTLYIIIPPELIPTQRTWLRLVLTVLTAVHRAVKPADRPNQHRTLFLIDEFPALGRMPDITTDLATMAGYGIDYALVVQGLDQLRHTYDKAAGTILSNCAFKWFCNVTDLDSAKYLSETLGKKTVQTIGKGENKGWNPGGENAGESVNYGETGRPLLMPDEIITLGRDKAIVLHPDSKPHYVRPIDYWNLEPAFARMQGQFPEMFWTPPLRFDANPYAPGSTAQG